MNRHKKFDQYLSHLNPYHRTILKMTLKKSGKIRSYYANKYLSGHGIEIGAESNPLIINKRNLNIQYVDRLTPEETSKIYNIPLEYIVKPDYFSEAHSLNIFPNKSFDFVIANHLIEHMVDPVGAIIEWLRVLRNDGILFLTVPNFRGNEYDFCRKPVNISHLIDNYRNSHLDLKTEHWEEFIEIVEGINPTEPAFLQRLQLFKEIDFRIHMHVFDKQLVIDLLNFLVSVGKTIEIMDHFSFTYSFELLFILKKCHNGETKLCRSNGLRNLMALIKSIT